MMKKTCLINQYLFIFLLCFFIINHYPSYSQSIDQKRDQAIELFNKGETQKSIFILKKLANKDQDPSSMLALGKIYLKNKDLENAFYWINLSGFKCNKSALASLKIFYLNKSSKYFDPYRYSQIVKKCDPKHQKIKNNKVAKKKVNESIGKTKPNKDKIIDNQVANLWSKIAQIEGKIVAHGTGFSISSNGYFLTNHHVVNGCLNIGIRYNNLYGKASIINFNENLDIALLKVNAPTPHYAKFSPEQYVAGEEIFVAGYPVMELFGTEMSVRKGTITSPQVRSFSNHRGRILIDASIASGNSGGPVINKHGAIRGVVTGGLSEKWIKKFEEKGILIGNSTFGLMISGNLVRLWLEEISTSPYDVIEKASSIEPKAIGRIAKKYTSLIECYEK